MVPPHAAPRTPSISASWRVTSPPRCYTDNTHSSVPHCEARYSACPMAAEPDRRADHRQHATGVRRGGDGCAPIERVYLQRGRTADRRRARLHGWLPRDVSDYGGAVRCLCPAGVSARRNRSGWHVYRVRWGGAGRRPGSYRPTQPGADGVRHARHAIGTMSGGMRFLRRACSAAIRHQRELRVRSVQ